MAGLLEKLKEKFCVVCKMGSHRSDWQDKENPACDHHSQGEVQAAIGAKTQTKPVLVPPLAAPFASPAASTPSAAPSVAPTTPPTTPPGPSK